MALAAIGSLPLPLMQRSVIIHMEKAADGSIKRFDTGDVATVHRINIVYGYVARWARSKPALDLNPGLPRNMRNRLADNWRVLVGIADSFGPAWARLAREAAVTFACTYHDEDVGVILLSDIRDIFNRMATDRVTSVDLIASLLEIDESAWGEYRGEQDSQQPRKLSPGEMARLLRPFGIRPRSVWPLTKRHEGASSRKGYYRSQFESAWARYCQPAGTTAQPTKVAFFGRH
jgi:Protein of unknown function (DUF3631)